MTPALWFLVRRTVANATTRAVAGLRRPSRLFGLLLGLAYLAWLSRQAGAGGMPDPARATTAGALGLLVLSATAWIAGTARPPTDATRSLLWPAPIGDRHLVVLSLVASQALVIPNVILWTLLASRGASAALLGRRAIALWLLFSTLMYHRALVGRLRGRTHGAHAWLRRGGTVLGLMLLAGIPFALTGSFNLVSGGLERLGTTGFGAILLWPFEVPVRPVSAPTLDAWLRSLPAAVLLLGVHVALLLRLGPTREPVQPGLAAAGPAVRPPPRGAVALAAWKAVTAVMRRTHVLLIITGSIAASLGLRALHARGNATAEFTGFLALTWAPLVLLLGPQFLRTGLRRDAEHLSLLRMLPARGHTWVLGGAIGSALLTALLAGGLLLVGLGGAGTSADLGRYGALRPAGFAAVIVLMMPIAMLGTLVQDTLFLLFPGPISLGAPRPGATRLGTSLLNSVISAAMLLLLLALPAAAGIGTALLALGPPALRLVGAAVAAALVAVGEVLVLARWLGARLDRTGAA